MSDVKLPEAVVELAKTLKAEMKVGAAGVVEISPDAYEKTLADGLTLKEVQAIQEHNANIVAATGLALGELGMDAFKKDKKLDQVSVSFKAGKDVHSATFQRSKEVPINKPGEERKTAPKYGILSNSVTVHGAGNKGTLKKVRAHLSEEAAKILAK